MKTLELLPIPTKNMLEESKVLPIIQRWAQTKTAVPQLSEGDGYSSENTSRAHTPLNTPDLSAKQSVEGDTDTPKKLVFRRLKIISENSMDSAISDTTSELEGKEGKEDLDQLEGAPTEASEEQQQQQEMKPAADVPVESSKPQVVELEAEPEVEVKESNGAKLEEPITMETPSQDEEEGVSDVESERSQEQTDKIVDVSDLATRLLDSWKDLKVRGTPGYPQHHHLCPCGGQRGVVGLKRSAAGLRRGPAGKSWTSTIAFGAFRVLSVCILSLQALPSGISNRFPGGFWSRCCPGGVVQSFWCCTPKMVQAGHHKNTSWWFWGGFGAAQEEGSSQMIRKRT